MKAIAFFRFLGWALVMGAASGACGDQYSAAPQCNEALDMCAAGQTCWVGGPRFDCYPSGEGQLGDACNPTDGSPTCTDGLFCISLTNRPEISRQCVHQCLESDDSPCDGGSCERISFDAETGSIWICVPDAP